MTCLLDGFVPLPRFQPSVARVLTRKGERMKCSLSCIPEAIYASGAWFSWEGGGLVFFFFHFVFLPLLLVVVAVAGVVLLLVVGVVISLNFHTLVVFFS